MPASLWVAVSRNGARSASLSVPRRTSHCVRSVRIREPERHNGGHGPSCTDDEADQQENPTLAVTVFRSTYLKCHV
jgi:hypothetical protein